MKPIQLLYRHFCCWYCFFYANFLWVSFCFSQPINHLPSMYALGQNILRSLYKIKMRSVCCNIWSSFFKSLFLKDASINTRVWFLFEIFSGGGRVSMGCRDRKKEFFSENNFWWKLTNQPKVWCVVCGIRCVCLGNGFCQHRERWWLENYIMLLVTCSLTPFLY